MKVLEHKCFGISNQRKYDTHYIVFKIDNGNHILCEFSLKQNEKKIKTIYYYIDEESYNLPKYDYNESISTDGYRMNRLTIKKYSEYKKVSYDERLLVDKYFNKNECQLIFRPKSEPYNIEVKYKPPIKCPINKIGYGGVIYRDEPQLFKECETHILVKFEIYDMNDFRELDEILPLDYDIEKHKKTIFVNRVVTTISNEIIDDEFYFSEREGWYDNPNKNPLKSNWKTKEEIGNKYCDYLSWVHFGLGQIHTNIHNEYLCGSLFITKDDYTNDEFLDKMVEINRRSIIDSYRTIEELLTEIEKEMRRLRKKGSIRELNG